MEKNNKSLIELFRERWLDVSGEYIEVGSNCDFASELNRFLGENSIDKVVIGGPPLTPMIAENLADGIEVLHDFGSQDSDFNDIKEACAKAGAGITGVDALIADTGTLVVVSRERGDRMLSVLPPVHLVIAHEAPIFRDLEGFLAAAPARLNFSFITGPSRTADIEKKLVLGAHGPKRVVVWGPGLI